MLALFLATAACGSDGYSWGIGGPGVPGGGSGSGGSGSGGSGGTGGGGSGGGSGGGTVVASTGTVERVTDGATRSEEHTSELQSLMRISYAVFCLKKKQIHSCNQQNVQRKPRTIE